MDGTAAVVLGVPPNVEANRLLARRTRRSESISRKPKGDWPKIDCEAARSVSMLRRVCTSTTMQTAARRPSSVVVGIT